jgi:gliding motility-associated-like protein
MKIIKITFYLLLLFFNKTLLYSQLSFCNGSKGDPVFIENFGSGLGYGPALSTLITSYTFISGTPNDGQYTLFNNTQMYPAWHNAPDHTPDNAANGTDGKMLLVNASVSPDAFYKRTVTGLCVNTTFEFSAWLMNVYNSTTVGVCSGSGIPVNVTFEIWDATETILLTSGNTGDIAGISNPIWTQFGLVFTVPAGQTTIILKMRNNGAGGCGNDLAIDDIAFSSCGDLGTISTNGVAGNVYNICQDQLPLNTTLTINIPNPSSHVFQWQYSLDGILWVDIVGENTPSYNIVNLNTTRYFRSKIAQDIANLSNPNCATVSDVFSVFVKNKPNPPIKIKDETICSNDPIPTLAVIVGTGESANWFDATNGGLLLQANSVFYLPTTSGTFYVETYIPNMTCSSSSRTAVSLTINPIPVVVDEKLYKCKLSSINLLSGISVQNYEWSTGEIIEDISTLNTGIYTVKITNASNCFAIKTIEVIDYIIPEISTINVNQKTVTIEMANSGNFLYSLDGINYQASNVFYNVTGGLRTAFVKEIHNCGLPQEMNFIVLVIPKFISPNNDGFNDIFEIEGIQNLPISNVTVFDRFGKLITQINSTNPSWDGTLNGKPIMADDYWYKINFTDGTENKGHFSIVR